MRNNNSDFFDSIDWLTVLIYFIMVFVGWLNIYAAVYDQELEQSLFDFKINSGKQLLWIGISIGIIILIFIIDFEFWEKGSYLIYILMLLSLIGVLLFGREIAGSKSWFQLGFIRIQPAEFAKLATALAIAKFFGSSNLKLSSFSSFSIAFVLFVLPTLLIIKQGDTGSALVFATFLIVFYREKLLPHFVMVLGVILVILFTVTLFLRENYLFHLIGVLVLLGGIGVFFARKNTQYIVAILGVVIIASSLVLSVDYFVSDVLKPHQQKRIEVLINPDADPTGAGWQVTQSKIAIGSGGFFGKGYLGGTQTKLDFVPDQSTDFIFCTVGEEHGWIGSMIVIFLFATLILRVIMIAERQKSTFNRAYGYGVASIFFFHFMVNMGMTIGLFPVIGIPLPFFSYGGSSLLSFTILLFVFLKVDAQRSSLLAH